MGPLKSAIIALALAFVPCTWAFVEQVRVVNIPAAAEDECPYWHGDIPLDEVLPAGDGVICQYDYF